MEEKASKGLFQRNEAKLTIARTLIHDPQVLFLDETTLSSFL